MPLPNRMPLGRDRNFFVIVLALTMVVGALPYVVGRLMAPAGALFYGNTVVAPYDSSIYYSYIEQGRQGHLFMADTFTSEPFGATLWQPVWFVLGQLANLLHVTTPAVFFLGRVAAIPIFAISLWWLASWVFPTHRRLAWLMLLGAGGLGGLVSVISGQPVYVNGVMSPDMWVTEAYPWLTLWGSPHFLLVSSGIIFVLAGIERAWIERQWKPLPVIGVVALLTLSIHPFHVVTWVVCWVILTSWRWVATRHFPRAYVLRWLAVLGMAAPALILYGLQLLFDPLTIGRALQNVNPMTPFGLTVLGLGIFIILAPLGAWWQRPHVERWQWLVGLAITYLIVVYAPLPFQRRLSQGLMIPFALLAVPAIRHIAEVVRRWSKAFRVLMVAAGLVLMSSTWLVVFGFIVKDYVDELAVAPKRMYYVSSEFTHLTSEVIRPLDDHRPILATLLESNIIAGLTAHHVYLGYGVETLNFDTKLAEMQRFYGQLNQSEQRQFLQARGICYVLDSPRAQAYGGAFQPRTWPDLTAVWTGPSSSLYQLATCR